MKELAIKLRTEGMLLVVPGAASFLEAGTIPTAALCAALLVIAGIHLLESAQAKPAA